MSAQTRALSNNFPTLFGFGMNENNNFMTKSLPVKWTDWGLISSALVRQITAQATMDQK